ncbi:MAG: DUF4397 domain-containing protein [Anaerolineae bacterium]|nr:DUF4397 domain-containing protein [Anaerolineae bacterium]
MRDSGKRPSSVRRLALAVLMAFAMVAALFAFPAPASAQTSATPGGRIRFVHAVADGPAVDIYVDSQLAAGGLEFGGATRFLAVEPGSREVEVMAGGGTTSLFKATVDVSADLGRTVVLQGAADTLAAGLYEDDLNPTRPGNVRVTAIHALDGAPAVDVLQVDGDTVMPLVQNLAFGQPYGAVDIPAAAADLVLVPAGGNVSNPVLRVSGVSLAAGTEVVVVALDGPTALVLSEPTAPDDAGNSGLVRMVHASQGSPAVDVYVGESLIAPGLSYGAATPHLALAAGTLDVAVRVAKSAPDSTPLVSATLDLAAGSAVTVVVSGPIDGLQVNAVANNIAPLDPKVARVQFTDATGAGATLSVAPGVTLDALDAPALEAPAGTYTLQVGLGGGDTLLTQPTTLSGGVLYDVIAAGAPDGALLTEPLLIVAATGLNEQPGSAPLPAVQVAVQPTEPAQATDAPSAATSTPLAIGVAPTPAPLVLPSSTPAPVELPVLPTATEAAVALAPTATLPPVVALPTATLPPLPVTATPDPNLAPAPTLAPPPVALVVTPTATPIGITGYLGQVDTNPGTNLKIREYPREDAKTLALAPSGAVLDIVGIRGPVQEPNQPTPTATATLSPEGLTIDQLWVFVIWRTDDGGQISGWTKPLYLITTDPRGRRLTTIEDFLMLNQVPENEFGEIATGLATPIPTRDLRPRARVARVNEGTNLQIRRLPDIQGESLALVPNGVEMIAIERTNVESRGGLVGEPESLTWVRVSLETDTGTVTGWVNSQYVDLYLAGRLITLEDLPEAAEIIPGDVAGNVTLATPPPAPGLIGTVDRLNPGANLHLRRTPDSAGESLTLIPAGAQIPIIGRNGAGTWFLTTYGGVEGWINGEYVTVTLDGRRYDVLEIPITTGEENTFGTPTVTPTPTAQS